MLSELQLLLVEDDELLADHTARALGRRNITVHQAHNASEALAVMEKQGSLDAAVLDQNLGDDSGLDLIAPILQRFPHCKVLLLTGYGSIAAAVAATHRGAHNYLTKPASASEIIEALEANPASLAPPLPATPPSLQRMEWEHIQRTLDAHDGNISRAADALGIHRRTLQRRLKKRPSASEYQREKNTNKD